MRHQPALVHGIAGEAAAEMVVDAALAHARERELDQTEIALVTQPQPGAPEELQHHGLRELGRAAHPAVHGIDESRNVAGDAVELRLADHGPAGGARACREPRHQRTAILLHALRRLAEDALDLA